MINLPHPPTDSTHAFSRECAACTHAQGCPAAPPALSHVPLSGNGCASEKQSLGFSYTFGPECVHTNVSACAQTLCEGECSGH